MYRNTIIFAVVAALLTVVLLVLVIAVPWASKYRFTFLTINVGLLAIIIYAIVKINRHAAAMDRLMEDAASSRLAVSTCPDYFTADYSRGAGRTMCIPKYESPRTDVVFKFQQQDGDMQPLDMRDYDGKRAGELCSYINSDNYQGVNQRYVPWVEMRAKCNAIRRAI